MKTLRLLPIAFLLLFSSSLIAQISGSPREFETTTEMYNQIRKLLNTKEKVPYKIDWENVKGSPYLTENYKLAKFSVGEKSYGNIMMRFNTYTDEIELLPEEGEEAGALMKLDDSKITFGNTTLALFDYTTEEGDAKKGYFLVLNSADNIKLVLKKKCVFSPNEKALTANQADRAAKFTQYDYFYIVKDGDFMEVSPKKKDILKIFPNQKNEIKEFIKTEKLKLKNQQDFGKLVDYIASISNMESN
ncbi:hypothetical protein C8N46_101553 [Kordia periserrulae]|uniref:Uncharacterized protein n=1 Tax=Kordia periserrulae TaxID=701523 RepID=A0A2T6C6L7_9FLAO|nr:hypothetical protein [Kordia periserrulae]PTX63943.1 hypothetical protein C8N46_101553 [Kordia periserrulae]